MTSDTAGNAEICDRLPHLAGRANAPREHLLAACASPSPFPLREAAVENLGRVISEHPFCKGFHPHYVDLLTGCSGNVRLLQGHHLFREGGEANQFYLIREGKILLEIPAPQAPSLSLETVEAGEVLGWSWLVPPYRWRFGARALEPVSAIAVNGRCLRAKCEKDADLAYALLKRTVEILGQRLDATRFRLLDLYSADTSREQTAVFSCSR